MRFAYGVLATMALASAALVGQAALISSEMDNMKTLVSLAGADELASSTKTTTTNNVVVDPTSLIDKINADAKANDIEEDPEDLFYTNRSGIPRSHLMVGAEADQWNEETLGAKILSRVKRCGGGGDDDGDANRSRRARRARARRARAQRRRAAKAARKIKKTTVTRRVIQNGKVVSQTSETSSNQHTVSSTSPVVVQQPAAMVVQAVPAATQVVAAPAVVPAASAPVPSASSVSVQAGVKIN